MRRLLLLAPVPVVMLAMAVGMTVMTALSRPPSAAGSSGSCLPTLAAGAAAGGNNTAVNAEQRGNAGKIIAIGQQQHLPPRAWQVAIQAAQTESNLINVNHGDRDSLGLFQMRPSAGWGSPDQLLNVDYEVQTFFKHLLAVRGWETMQPGDAAQQVEQSGYPDRYQRVERLAADLISTLGGQLDPSGCGQMPPAPQVAQAAIAFAQQQSGKPYAWGAVGPDAWDCSSLTQAAYRASGITLPRTSRDQVAAGRHVPINQAQPGDLVFWGTARNPDYAHHVAIYVGNNQVIHAPDSGQTVTTRPLWDGGELIPEVTRPEPAAQSRA